jgi:hypothetical protein
METETKVVDEVSTHIAARILGVCHRTIIKYRLNGKIKSARRSSSAKKSPWLFDREEIISLKNEIKT